MSGQASFAPFAPKLPLSLEAHEVGTGDQRYTWWEDEYGGYDRDSYRSKSILITLHDLSGKSPGADVSAYFIATAAGRPRGPHFIYDRIEGFIKFDGKREWTRKVAPRRLKKNIQNYPLLGSSYALGADMDGWIVIAKSDGYRFGTYASSQKLLQIALGHGPESFDEMVAAYNKTNPPRNEPRVATNGQTPVGQQGNSPGVSASFGPNATPPDDGKVTLIQSVIVQATTGSTTLPVGTKVELISRANSNLHVRYAGRDLWIPSTSAK